jgi:glycerophosphoryl diester phosphodiesterase
VIPRAGKRPIVIAHRGAAVAAPENSLAAFRLAEALGADAIELDVMRCASGEVVVFHDHTLAKFGGRVGEEVRALTYARLRRIDLGGGERIPLLAEVLDAVGRDVQLAIELKTRPTLRIAVDDGLASEVARMLAGHEHRALVSSFDPLLLSRFAARAPGVPTALLFRKHPIVLRQTWLAPLLRPSVVQPELSLVERRRVARWHARGLAVHVWPTDKPAAVTLAYHLGVDGVITRDPAMARMVLTELEREVG